MRCDVGVAPAQLTRPEVRNVLNLALRRQLAAAFLALGAETEVRVIVIASDTKAFCAGAVLGEYVDASPIEIVRRNMQQNAKILIPSSARG